MAVQEELARQIEGGLGIFTRYCVKSDNSCLFASINYLLHSEDFSIPQLRQLVADTIISNPAKYNEAFLDQSPADYCFWISQPSSWGGAIELDVFAHHYCLQINVVDTRTLQIFKFGEDSQYQDMLFLVYNGFHYDPLVVDCPDPASPPQKVFSLANDSHLFDKAVELAAEINTLSSHYTCSDCGAVFHSAQEMASHSQTTGHVNYNG
ncbi:ubiquitin thioesterase OTU1-like [Octopus sinensis]|uniref:Ubiquitin thioesterase OTU n=1 Tax=Octopus sinensis TaxID=2607531 RepID=A0A6P7TYI0_9MOLL|nr:ubiquitin thioesterase OTU1-like [Octopus sinensis]